MISREHRGKLLVDAGVELLLPPALGGVDKLEVEVASVVADLALQHADWKGAATTVVGPHLENGFPKSPARVDAKEAFTKGHKDRMCSMLFGVKSWICTS